MLAPRQTHLSSAVLGLSREAAALRHAQAAARLAAAPKSWGSSLPSVVAVTPSLRLSAVPVAPTAPVRSSPAMRAKQRRHVYPKQAPQPKTEVQLAKEAARKASLQQLSNEIRRRRQGVKK